jgi:hypothetical protein
VYYYNSGGSGVGAQVTSFAMPGSTYTKRTKTIAPADIPDTAAFIGVKIQVQGLADSNGFDAEIDVDLSYWGQVYFLNPGTWLEGKPA